MYFLSISTVLLLPFIHLYPLPLPSHPPLQCIFIKDKTLISSLNLRSLSHSFTNSQNILPHILDSKNKTFIALREIVV